ncbi:ribosome biogenesis GTP-binding protein YihA/YsxC [Thioalkalivibrio sp. HK1]|uniref:ribosome biogenesis GTP-binding protein YihA/YsxC n=1 Tax=Thioalkalivibrio sp. HK1 TaxID=1469245 RepID=UPI0004700D4E|nr:ribosome biogenesis GTP-binding protein YihA/YsxC [Thioalkalivibrio sp. HK1]
MLDYRQTKFLVSASKVREFPLDEGREVAFAGRSNAGKSSLINALCRRKALARTSRTPGRTRLINFFGVGDSLRLVDLPGYGYAKAPRSMSQAWGRLVEEYLHRRRSLAGVVLLMDIRHPLTALDRILIEGCRLGEIPLLMVLSKADKLASKRRSMAIKEVRLSLCDLFAEGSTNERSNLDAIGQGRSPPTPPKVMAHSVPGKIGYEDLAAHLSDWLEGE